MIKRLFNIISSYVSSMPYVDKHGKIHNFTNVMLNYEVGKSKSHSLFKSVFTPDYKREKSLDKQYRIYQSP